MKARCQLEHRLVLGKDVCDYAAEFLAAGHLDQPANQLRSKPCTLAAICHQDSEFGILRRPLPRQPAHAKKLVPAGLRVGAVGHQRHFTVVVDKTFSNQPVVRDAGIELLLVKVT